MKNTALIVALVFLTGCAAPPPVKIASKLLGRTVVKEAKDEFQSPDASPVTNPQ